MARTAAATSHGHTFLLCAGGGSSVGGRSGSSARVCLPALLVLLPVPALLVLRGSRGSGDLPAAPGVPGVAAGGASTVVVCDGSSVTMTGNFTSRVRAFRAGPRGAPAPRIAGSASSVLDTITPPGRRVPMRPPPRREAWGSLQPRGRRGGGRIG